MIQTRSRSKGWSVWRAISSAHARAHLSTSLRATSGWKETVVPASRAIAMTMGRYLDGLSGADSPASSIHFTGPAGSGGRSMSRPRFISVHSARRGFGESACRPRFFLVHTTHPRRCKTNHDTYQPCDDTKGYAEFTLAIIIFKLIFVIFRSPYRGIRSRTKAPWPAEATGVSVG